MYRGLIPCLVRVASVLHSRCPHHITFVANLRPWLFVRPGQSSSVLHPYGVRVMSVSHPCHISEFAQGYATEVIRIWQGQHGCGTDMAREQYGFDTDICPCQLFRLSQNRHGQIWPWRPWRTSHGCDKNTDRSTRTWYGYLYVSHPCFNRCMCKRSIISEPLLLYWELYQYNLLKGLRMVARALWRSEARRVVPWSETLHEP